MPPVKRKTITQGLPSQNFDGRLTFVGGFSGQGKTSSVLAELPDPFLFVCTDVSNPTVKKLPWVEDSDAGLQYVLDNPLKTMAVRCYNGNPDILSVCRDHRRAVCLDEIGNLFHSGPMMNELLDYAREVRYKDGGVNVWATSQRPACDVRPGIYFAARRIKWVGPLFDEKALKVLFSHRSANLNWKAFQNDIGNLESYCWHEPNVSKSIYVVKDL